MQTKLSALCCQRMALPNLVSSKATVTLWPLPESESTIGLLTPVNRRVESGRAGGLGQRDLRGGGRLRAVGLSEQVAAVMSKRTFSSALVAK